MSGTPNAPKAPAPAFPASGPAPAKHRGSNWTEHRETRTINVRLPSAWLVSLETLARASGLPLASLLRHILELGLDVPPGELMTPRASNQRRLRAVQAAVREAIGAEAHIALAAEWREQQRAQSHPGRAADLRPHRLNPPGERLAQRLRAEADAQSLLVAQDRGELDDPPPIDEGPPPVPPPRPSPF